jgi:signal transduction histidine kinase
MSERDRDAALPEEVRSAFDYMPATLAGNVAGIAVVSLLFARITPLAVFAPWLLVFVAMIALRALLAWRFARADVATLAEWRRWRLLWNVGTLAAGALWGTTAWIFYGRGDANQQIALAVTVYTFCIAAVPVLATQPRLFLAFAALCFVPLISRVAFDGTRPNWELAGILLLIFTLTSALARNYRQALEREIDLKLTSDRLADQLRLEKQVSEAARQAADQARHVAEVASRAKTQFFAAASHDLRQPLHALGLFAEALRQKSRDDETMQLINSINGSVDALDGLFSELLDITKIDTGGVEPRPTDFQLDEVFRKIRLHFEPVAFEKGLMLKVRGGHRHAYADPLLVERIVRNLTANAIRYTNDGGVLVSARTRGPKLLLQVWDSGVGIGEADRERVFDEFVQLHDPAAAPDPHQRKGLGLGLSIVRRLAALMNAPLTLRSRAGRGTVFTLELPLGRARPAAAPPLRSSAPLGLTLDRRLVVMIEDDPAVKSGLEVLLKSWGASVISFDSLQACEQWAQAAEPSMLQPDLIVADYRLESGHTGVEAIRALRGMLGRPIPAIVVTGSVLSSHEREAAEHDFHLLLKPVVPGKLRAMIAFKLGLR